MSRESMLGRLKAIEHPMIAAVALSETGTEFRILTAEAGYFCMAGGTWPIQGPVSFGAANFSAAKRLAEAGYDPHSEEYDLLEFLEAGRVHLPPEELQSTTGLSEARMVVLGRMREAGCEPDQSYFVYWREPDGACSFHRTYEEALDALVDGYVGEGGTPWEQMGEDELAEWVECMDGAQTTPGRSEAQPV